MINPMMSLAHSWEKRDILQEFLAAQLLKGRIALVLGAGISVPFGLPAWATLITRMYEGVGVDPEASMTLPRQAEVFRVTHCRGDRDLYMASIKKALYQDVKVDFWTQQSLLVAIGALVMASKRGNASDVITFNFDDILESYLEFHGFVAESIVNDKYWSGSADVRIFHPHGLLPMRSTVMADYDPVLDQASFSSVLHGERGRIWEKTLLNIMQSHTCLFVGLSGSDDNLESLLHRCYPDHVSIAEKHAFWGLRFSDSDNASWKTLWAERGVSTWVVNDYSRDLPAFLLEVCQLAAQFRLRGM